MTNYSPGSEILTELSTVTEYTVKLEFKEWLDKEQLDNSEPFPVTNMPVHLINSEVLCLVLLWVQNDFGPSKLFWLSNNHFGQVHFVLVGFKSFWTGPINKN